MSKNKYNLMLDSIVTDEKGNPFPDLATFPINSFIPSARYTPVELYEQDIYTFYNLIYKGYSNFNLYDDITLWLNDIPYLDSSYQDVLIMIFAKMDIDAWYLNYIK